LPDIIRNWCKTSKKSSIEISNVAKSIIDYNENSNFDVADAPNITIVEM